MESSLKKVIGDLNKSRGVMDDGHAAGPLDSQANPISKIVAVLNNHHDSLAWLDEKSR